MYTNKVLTKVVTTCPSRFHIYDQAAQLEKNKLLYRLLHAYPYKILKKWGVSKKSTRLIKETFIDNVIQRMLMHLQAPSAIARRFDKYYHEHFSSALLKYIPQETEVLIGLSSFMYKAFERLPSSIVKIVDHGSLHLSYVKNVLMKEAEYRKLNPAVLGIPEDWVINAEQYEFETSDFIFLCSDLARETAIMHGVEREKIFVNPLGVDTKTFYPRKKEHEKFIILFVGNITLTKGIYYLMKAFNDLKLENAELWLVGRESVIDAEKMFLRNLVSENIKLIGHVPQSDLPSIYAQSSIFVFPSLADGFGMVVPQALASGIPVIISQNAGAKSLVTNGENGFIIDAHDSLALCDRINTLYKNPELRMVMSENAKKIQTDLSWDAYGKRLANFINNLHKE